MKQCDGGALEVYRGSAAAGTEPFRFYERRWRSSFPQRAAVPRPSDKLFAGVLRTGKQSSR